MEKFTYPEAIWILRETWEGGREGGSAKARDWHRYGYQLHPAAQKQAERVTAPRLGVCLMA